MISCERVYKAFDEPVLRGVSLMVPRRALLGLVGPPGAGKSVLLRAIAGLIDADAGSIQVAGREVVHADYQARRELQRGIGMLFQNVALFDFMTVGENIAFPLERSDQLSKAEVARRVAEELGEVGLSGFEGRMPAELSGGQKRRVGIARAGITRPPLLIYDEPAAGLDPVSTSRIFRLLKAQKDRLGATLLVVSSDIDRLLPVTDELAVMHKGRVVTQGTEDDVRRAGIPLVTQFLEGRTDGPL